jgi:hypothetical protein
MWKKNVIEVNAACQEISHASLDTLAICSLSRCMMSRCDSGNVTDTVSMGIVLEIAWVPAVRIDDTASCFGLRLGNRKLCSHDAPPNKIGALSFAGSAVLCWWARGPGGGGGLQVNTVRGFKAFYGRSLFHLNCPKIQVPKHTVCSHSNTCNPLYILLLMRHYQVIRAMPCPA